MPDAIKRISGKYSVEYSSQMELLTVIIPVYNEAKWLPETLISVQNQTLANLKILIGDNASNDGSQEIIAKAAKTDNRIDCVFRRVNIGAVGNIADLVQRCHTPFISFIGAHDLLDQGWAKSLTDLLLENPSVSLAYSRISWINSCGQIFQETDGGDFVRTEETPFKRIIACISHQWGECTAVNGVFRAPILNSFWFPKAYGPDHVLLARSSYLGKILRIERPLYLRRQFERQSVYIERIMGDSRFRRTPGINSLIAAHIFDLLLLEGISILSAFKLSACNHALRSGYGRQNIAGLARIFLWLMYFLLASPFPGNRIHVAACSTIIDPRSLPS